MKSINITVPQGIGDIFWIYQKLALSVGTINLKVGVVSDDPLQFRSTEWMKILPQVGKVEFEKMTGERYSEIANCKITTEQLLEKAKAAPDAWHDFGMNKWLEDGVALDKIDDPERFPVDWNIPLPYLKRELPRPHAVLYVTGSMHHAPALKQGAWNTRKFTTCWEHCVEKLGLQGHQLIIIGATYDLPVLAEARNLLQRFDPTIVCNDSPAAVMGIMKGADFMLGFQSGMCILADHLNVRQLMIYYNHLKPLATAWPRPDNLENGKYNIAFFNDEPEIAANQIAI